MPLVDVLIRDVKRLTKPEQKALLDTLVKLDPFPYGWYDRIEFLENILRNFKIEIESIVKEAI
jgi:hypothetical protein